MANRGDRSRPKSWASGLRPVSRDKSGTAQETPQSANPTDEKEFRFLMGQSFMDGGLDGLMGEPALTGKRPRDTQEEESQEAVDNMLSNILKKTKTELQHISPSLPDSHQQNASYQFSSNPYHSHYRYPSMDGGPTPPIIDVSRPPPPFIDTSQPPPPFIDTSQPPPNYIHSPVEPEQTSSHLTPASSLAADEAAGKIERKWGNILKSNDASTSRRVSESNISASPSMGSASPFESPSANEYASSSMATRSPSTKVAEVPPVMSERPLDESSSSKVGRDAVALIPESMKSKSGFKDVTSYDIDPINMTYCGKEFIDIVDVPARKSGDINSEAICHLCRLNRLMPQDLALHLDGEKHYKNLRNFIMEKEYDLYNAKLDDPLHLATFPDFNTYMLRRYPSRLEEYFEKTLVVHPITMNTRSEFQLKYKPLKMLLAEKDGARWHLPPPKVVETKKTVKVKLSECPYCSEMIALDKIATHACDAMKTSEEAPTRTNRVGIPNIVRKKDKETAKSTPLVIPADAIDVQFKLDMCKEYEKFAQCQYGNKCTFAHSTAELNSFTYRRTKTEMCEIKGCLELCGKAHSRDELVVCSKTALCRSYVELESCQYKDKCQFAHGMKELLSPWDSRPLAFGNSGDSSTKAPSPALEKKMESQKPAKSKIKLTLKKF